MRKKRCCARAGAFASVRAPSPAPNASASRRVITVIRCPPRLIPSACTRKPCTVHHGGGQPRGRRVPANVLRGDHVTARTNPPRRDDFRHPALGGNREPTSEKAAVNRMIDLVQADV